MEEELKKFYTRKIFRLTGRLQGTDQPTSVVTEVLAPDEEVTTSEFASFSCGHRFDPAKAFVDRFTGAVVCEACVVECCQCHTKLWAEAAFLSLTGDCFCPDHRGWSLVRFLEKILFKNDRKED